ncbi:MAG: hypothetical protein ACXWMV_02035 [Syntrophales bacterium]
MELKIGSPVEATDGPLGHVHQVILSSEQRQVVGLVIRTGLLRRRNRVVPTDLIASVNDAKVSLRVSRDDVIQQPEFDPTQYLPLPAEQYGYMAGEALTSIHDSVGEGAHVTANRHEMPESAHRSKLEGHTIALLRGQKVWATDGRAGSVDLLLLDANEQVRHFVIRKGHLPGRDVIVPVNWISTIDERGVWLAVGRTALDHLPVYRPDSAIAEDVARALWMDEVIRALDFESIGIAVHLVSLGNLSRLNRSNMIYDK